MIKKPDNDRMKLKFLRNDIREIIRDYEMMGSEEINIDCKMVIQDLEKLLEV